MVVVVLLLVLLAAVLVPPAVRAQAARRDAFVVSLGRDDESGEAAPRRMRSPKVERRRQILGSLLIAMAGTGLIGLLPMFRTLLIVHLFLVDAFLAYVGVLARMGDRRARRAASATMAERGLAVDEAEPLPAPVPLRERRLRPRPALRPDLEPIAATG